MTTFSARSNYKRLRYYYIEWAKGYLGDAARCRHYGQRADAAHYLNKARDNRRRAARMNEQIATLDSIIRETTP